MIDSNRSYFGELLPLLLTGSSERLQVLGTNEQHSATFAWDAVEWDAVVAGKCWGRSVPGAPHSYSGARLALTKLTESCRGPRRNDESPMAMMSGGEALARSLAGEGVDVRIRDPGIQIYGIVAALRDQPGIRLISTRHEQATTYMADGYARASGSPGVALVVPAWACTTLRRD